MTPEQYLHEAEKSLAASNYAAATAYAGLATATAAVATMQASTPPALYPGEHAPPLIEWCGKCHAPGHRVKVGVNREQVPCKACSYDVQPEVRPCRYCQAYIQTQGKSGTVRNSTWADSRGSRWCPNAPDPSQPQPVTEEADLTPDSLWIRFLQGLYSSSDPQPTEGLIDTYRKAYYFPVTRYDQVPTPEQLERWLTARLDRVYVSREDQVRYQLVEKTGPDGESLWTATREGGL